MKKLIGLATLFPLVLPLAAPVQAAPASWTILRQVCWSISETAGQCAVGLYGSFATLQACQAANGGKLHAEATTTDGRKIGQRCEIKLEGEF